MELIENIFSDGYHMVTRSQDKGFYLVVSVQWSLRSLDLYTLIKSILEFRFRLRRKYCSS